jgi:hypothetical protein
MGIIDLCGKIAKIDRYVEYSGHLLEIGIGDESELNTLTHTKTALLYTRKHYYRLLEPSIDILELRSSLESLDDSCSDFATETERSVIGALQTKRAGLYWKAEQKDAKLYEGLLDLLDECDKDQAAEIALCPERFFCLGLNYIGDKYGHSFEIYIEERE